MRDLTSSIIEQYKLTEATLNGFSGGAVHMRRQSAFEVFRKLTFPTLRHEEWKHTNIKSVLSADYSVRADVVDVPIPDIAALGAQEHDSILVFVNGRYSAQHSRLNHTNLHAGSLHESYREYAELIDQTCATVVDPSTNSFVAANTACMNDGVFISVPANTKVTSTIFVLNVLDARTTNRLVQPRNVVTLGANSSCSIVMRSMTMGSEHSMCNAVSEFVLAENAQLECTVVQDDSATASQINTIQCLQHRSSTSTIVTVSLSGHIVRNDVGTKLREPGSEAHMFGVYCIGGTTIVDNHTVMDHEAPNCHSNELFKGILDAYAQGVFNGKIFVRPDAQKTLAYQSNRNVLLSETASVNTKPQLEIFADDVKCSHGCTVGKLDDEALFYLQARGIGERNARALLLTAFAEDVTSRISHEGVRAFINQQIEHRLLLETP